MTPLFLTPLRPFPARLSPRERMLPMIKIHGVIGGYVWSLADLDPFNSDRIRANAGLLGDKTPFMVDLLAWFGVS